MKVALALAVALSLRVTATAHAQPGAAPIAPPMEPPPGPAPADEASPLAAVALSFGLPLALGLAAGGLAAENQHRGAAVVGLVAATVAPSTGWFYAGRPVHGIVTTGVRAAAVLVAVRMLENLDAPPGDRAVGRGEGLAFVTFTAFVGATLVDWIGAPIAVYQDNDRARRARARPVVIPTVHPGGGGLALGGAF